VGRCGGCGSGEEGMNRRTDRMSYSTVLSGHDNDEHEEHAVPRDAYPRRCMMWQMPMFDDVADGRAETTV